VHRKLGTVARARLLFPRNCSQFANCPRSERRVSKLDAREWKRADRIPPWNHALAVANGTIVLGLEVLLVGFLTLPGEGTTPDYVRLAAFAWLIRGTWEVSYWHVLTQDEVEPLRGRRLVWYWLIGMPQAFLPFLVAERLFTRSRGGPAGGGI